MPVKTEHKIISRSDLKTLIDEKQDFELIEVLPEESYAGSHLPGAMNIPGDRLRATIEQKVPDKNERLVVYCSSPSCTASDRAARLLTKMGYNHVFHYRGGKQHWKEGGLDLESRKN